MAARDMTPEQYIAHYGPVQAGPCAGCGAEGYNLSMGGPGICPACDSQPPERRVRQLADENRVLRQRIAELEGREQVSTMGDGDGA